MGWAIIQWIAARGRLPTKDRLLSWGVVSDSRCILCDEEPECHNHLFFTCSFSSYVWKQILGNNNVVRILSSLAQELE